MEPKFARFSTTSAPQGGFCVSVFIACKKASKILLCKMTRPEDWYEQDGLPREKAAEMIQSGRWVLPAAHLLYGEDLEIAARRVVKSHLGVSRGEFRSLGLYSFTTRRDDDTVHWDLCSLYEVIVKQKVRPARWYSKVEYVDVKRLKAEHFTRGHDDVLAAAGIMTN